MKKAFLVIVEYPDDTVFPPCISDIAWALTPKGWVMDDFNVHTTEATAEMLEHHGIPL